jgi:hypothetical protein
MTNATPVAVAVLVAELLPALAFGLAAERVAKAIARWPVALRAASPAVLVLPYAALAILQHMFQWEWFAIYAILPVAMAWLMERAAAVQSSAATGVTHSFC